MVEKSGLTLRMAQPQIYPTHGLVVAGTVDSREKVLTGAKMARRTAEGRGNIHEMTRRASLAACEELQPDEASTGTRTSIRVPAEKRRDVIPTAESVDDRLLTTVVRKATGRKNLELLAWSSVPLLHHARQITAGIHRLTGRGIDEGGIVPWSVVLKVIRPSAHFLTPGSCFYWKREALVFQAKLLDELEGDLVPVHCLDVVEREDGSIWLWLEDVVEAAPRWDLDRHSLAAYHFGVLNGSYLSKPLPSYTWLGRHFLRSWLAEYSSLGALAALEDPSLWAHPLLEGTLPKATAAALLDLIKKSEPLLTLLERQPHTLSHLDAHRPNLFSRQSHGREQTVVIDWASLGMAAVGEELGMQVLGNLFILEVEPADSKGYQEAALEAYLDGLHEAGWQGCQRAVRFAYALSAGLRYATFLPLQLKGLAEEGELPPWGRSWAERRKLSTREVLARWKEALGFLLELAREARQLAREFKYSSSPGCRW